MLQFSPSRDQYWAEVGREVSTSRGCSRFDAERPGKRDKSERDAPLFKTTSCRPRQGQFLEIAGPDRPRKHAEQGSVWKRR
ncbi:hypothetical protein VTH06DRAFT_6614 [Thermothelomyces fergusii]